MMELDLGYGRWMRGENGDVVSLCLQLSVGEGDAIGFHKQTEPFPLNVRGLLCGNITTEVRRVPLALEAGTEAG